MALVDQLNVVACGAGDVIGTGQQGCQFDWQRIVGIEFSAGTYAYTDEQTLVNIRTAQQKKDVILINGFESFKHIEAAPKTSVSEGSGEKSVDGELPYEFEGMFRNKGMNFWKAMRRLNSNGVQNVAFYDINGSKIMTQTKGGIVKGFKTSMVFTDKYINKDGTNPSEFKFMLQLSDASIKEMELATWIQGSQVDYSIDELEGINDVLFTPSALAVGATSLVVKATLMDKTHFAGGFVTGDFIVKKGGVLVVHSAVASDAVAGTYTLTIPAATAATYTVETKNAYGTGVVLVTSNGLLFDSNIGTVIAA
jgi:hypothetical protein